MRNSKPCLTILSATRRFARTCRSCPYGTPTSAAPTFIDPTAHIINGYAVIVSSSSFIGPYSKLNAHGGIIKIGVGSAILDNASIVANPLHPHTAPAPEVRIGNKVVIGYGAQVLGPSTIGAYGSGAAQTGIGPGAVIDQANIAAWRVRLGPGAGRARSHRTHRKPGPARQECDDRRGSSNPAARS